jgi:hypothetical protein
MPSTSTTVQEPGSSLARATAAVSAALLAPAASVTAASASTSTFPSVAADAFLAARVEIPTVMQRSTDRIRTTHVGSLARPPALLDLMRAAAAGGPVDPAGLAGQERAAVTDVVARQRAAGLDVVCDGEQTKTGFFAYIGERLSGFEPRPAATRWPGSRPRSTPCRSTTREIHPRIVWAKFESLAEGARRATARLWP